MQICRFLREVAFSPKPYLFSIFLILKFQFKNIKIKKNLKNSENDSSWSCIGVVSQYDLSHVPPPKLCPSRIHYFVICLSNINMLFLILKMLLMLLCRTQVVTEIINSHQLENVTLANLPFDSKFHSCGFIVFSFHVSLVFLFGYFCH